jgi:hypothetical protein
VLKNGTIGSFFNYNTGFDVLLLDANDDVVDYVSVDGHTQQEQGACTGTALAFPYQISSPGAKIKFIFRSPDGTGAAALDNFSISPATTSASTCFANAVTIIAQNAGNNPVPNYTNIIQITVSTGNGNWSINNADGTLSPNPNPDADDDGTVAYTFVDTDNSEIVLDLTNTHAEETVTIIVSDPAEGVTSASAPLTFSRNVFVITEDPIQIAGRPQAMAIEMWTDDAAASPSCAIDGYRSVNQYRHDS